MKIEYLADSAVSEAENLELIDLLSTCFTGAHNEMFKSRRYYQEAPAHRMVIRNDAGVIKAHIAGHDKTISTESGKLRVLGIAEVAVHPNWRGKALSRKILAEFERWGAENGFAFSVLFGDQELYGPQGYIAAKNPTQHVAMKTGTTLTVQFSNLQYKKLGNSIWPKGEISLGGIIW